MNKVIHVVLTGGVGSRLWPLSRKSKPKQYLDLFSGKSLFEQTISRNAATASHLIIVGNRNNHHLSLEVVNKLELTNYNTIVEATPRNTAAAIAFAALAVSPEDILIVTPSDHIIEGQEEYHEAMGHAIQKANDGYLVTFGIQPTRPETEYGYIEYSGDDVVSFREKPNANTAQHFLEQGNFLWNSGMFCFKAGTFLEELKIHAPAVYEKAQNAWLQNQNGSLDEQLSLEIPSISIDYAVMERSHKIKVVPTSFRWSDLGSYESVYEYLKSTGHPVDANGNMTIGTNMFTIFAGLQNTIFICTDNAYLILKKEASNEIKTLYATLEKENPALIN